MGEEEKKAEEKTVEPEQKEGGKKEEAQPDKEDKKDADGGGDGGEKKASEGGGDSEEAKDAPPPPPPEVVIMRVYMHCEGCARKVRRSLRGFEGVEDVVTDCRSHKVVVKGKVAAADPSKVVERVQKKTGRKVELLTPMPPKPEKEEVKKEEEKPKMEEKKEEPQVIAVVLKVHMHCEACTLEIKKRILKMKGIQSVDPELKISQVTVKGVFDPPKLVEYVYKRTGKHAVVVKVEPDQKPAEQSKDEEAGKEKKDDGGGDEKKESGEGDGGKKKEGEEKDKEGDAGGGGVEEEGKEATPDDVASEVKKVEFKRNEFYYYYPRFAVEYAYPPQIFSDENPNACSVM